MDVHKHFEQMLMLASAHEHGFSEPLLGTTHFLSYHTRSIVPCTKAIVFLICYVCRCAIYMES